MDPATMTAITQYGIPVAALVAIWIAGRQGAGWLMTRVVEPLAVKHMEFLDSTTATMKQQASAAEKTADTLEALGKAHAISSEHIAEIRINTSKLTCLMKPQQ